MPPPSPIRVLIIDDDAMSRELLAVLLEGEGYAVDAAESGEAALTLLGELQRTPELILTDMQLPGISGAALGRELRAACGPSTMLIAISGSQPAADALSQFDGFLLKPFQMDEVAALLRARNMPGREKKISPVSAKPAAKGSAKEAIKNPEAPATGNPALRKGISPVSSKRPSGAASAPKSASKEKMSLGTQDRPSAAEKAVTELPLPVLNETIFQQLAGTMLGSQLQEMYMLCLSDARQRIAGMRKLAADHNGVKFVREAHAIKGGTGMLGATELHRRAAELESHGLAGGAKGELEDVNSLDELSAACDRLERMLGSRL